MTRDKELELLRASLEIVRGKVPAMSEGEGSVPVANYLDEARFEQERALFRRSLNVAALSTQVATPGDFITTCLAGTPTIIVRGDDDRVRAFINVCRHRGARVETRDHGRCKAFVCPYHAWTYRTDGALHHVRLREGFPRLRDEEASLVGLSCVEAGGLVWVCPDPQVRHEGLDAPTERLVEELEGVLGPRPTVAASKVGDWQANWKLVVDGGLESYHFRIAHRNTVSRFFGDTDSSYEFIGEHIRSILPRRSIVELEGRPTSEWNLRDHANVLYTVAPNVVFLVQKTHFDMVVSEPIAVDRTRVGVVTVGRAPGPQGYSAQAREFLQQNHEFTVKTLDEDFVLAEQIQSGMKSGANTHFRFARFEGALTQWHRRLDARLGVEPTFAV